LLLRTTTLRGRTERTERMEMIATRKATEGWWAVTEKRGKKVGVVVTVSGTTLMERR
jgi:hypothetical protein